MAAMIWPSVVFGVDLAAADLGQHGGRPPHRLRHVAEARLHVTLDHVHRRSCGQQRTDKEDDAGQQRAPLTRDETPDGAERRRVAGELEEAQQPRQHQLLVARKKDLERHRQQRDRVDEHQRRRGKAQARAERRMLPQQRMLGRHPDARHILDREHGHAYPIEQPQAAAVVGGDVGHRVDHRRRHVGHDEDDQQPVDRARGGLAPPTVLQHLESAFAQLSQPVRLGVHCFLPGRPSGRRARPLRRERAMPPV